MNGDYKTQLCDERHASLKEKEEAQDKRLDTHGKRLDVLEQHKVRVDTQIENLISKIEDLIGVLKWFLLGLIGSGGSFLLWQLKELIQRI